MFENNNSAITQWNSWYEKYVHPLFIGNNHDEYFQMLQVMKPPFFPEEKVALEFMEFIQSDTRFDPELKHYFSFLAACGFFKSYNLIFEDWINSDCWFNPKHPDVKTQSIVEFCRSGHGIEHLKTQLRWLPFLQRPDGN